MKNQNKILMSLLTASVTALSTAPTLASSLEGSNIKELENANENKLIDLMAMFKIDSLTENQVLIRQDIKSQVQAMLSKKAPIIKIGENINIVVDSYGKNHESIKQEVFDDLNLAAGGVQDSTNLIINGSTATIPKPAIACHLQCHTACHGACHGSRGWR
jgi:hypothetical protein